MINIDQVQDIIGRTVTTTSGDKIGKAGQVYLDDQSGQPEWVTVQTGLFGTKESFVPLADAELDGDTLAVPFDKDTVHGAPKVDVDGGHLDESEEAGLYAHYGLADKTSSDSSNGLDRVAGIDSDGDAPGTVGHDTSGPTTDTAMTRSEQQLHGGTEKVTAGKARLRKYVETEQQTITVPVTTEKAVLVTEPITDANRGDATAGRDISEEEHEVTLTEERVVVAKETVPIERVRIEKAVETREETVTEDVRKERFDTSGVEGGDSVDLNEKSNR